MSQQTDAAPENQSLPESDIMSHPGQYPGVVKKPDKKVVIGEALPEQSLEALMSIPIGYTGKYSEFERLKRAFQSLPLCEFERFCQLMDERSLALNPVDHSGVRFLDYLKTFPSQLEYAKVLEKFLTEH